MAGRSNADRRRDAAIALAAYPAQDPDDAAFVTNIGDLIADLLHLAEAHEEGSVDAYLLSRAERHWAEETREEAVPVD